MTVSRRDALRTLAAGSLALLGTPRLSAQPQTTKLLIRGGRIVNADSSRDADLLIHWRSDYRHRCPASTSQEPRAGVPLTLPLKGGLPKRSWVKISQVRTPPPSGSAAAAGGPRRRSSHWSSRG